MDLKECGYGVGSRTPLCDARSRKLDVWHKSHELTLLVHRATDSPGFPRRYPLINQLQSSALSIESNIVEGATRDSRPEFLRFLRYALSSGCELHTQLLVAKDLAYLPVADFQRMDSLLDEIRKMLWSLIVTVAAAERAASDLKLRT